ncbi:MAG: 16S rRNA (uracil(1498)-N(3))-methyltransferase [Deltaproteobacteria bacterium]|nr:16S rRNA (uracil(1498)-N(3))-methyltransferase [Deltaproteobacteria bacterium]MBW2042640.1 16S rRNA (uracil(1498)-N(3))-methyltransferase [Deltaproteobacteria bacterium]MBW2133190.1 16S rRNA (uracil(1498)-N(3))-methyltransferase [Deltaproteobacteria bacterium]
MRRFFVPPENLHNDPPEVTGPEAVHIAAVLRLKEGDAVILFDGTGCEYDAVILSATKKRVAFQVSGKRRKPAASFIPVTIAQALLKERKMDLVARQLAELGIVSLIPFSAERCVARIDSERTRHRRKRWEKIVREAMKQCKRNTAMVIGEIMSFDDILALGDRFDHRILFWEKADTPFHPHRRETKEEPGPVIAVLGPEGGFSDKEAAHAAKAGFIPVSLGPLILKSETAAVAAAALLQYLFGNLFPLGVKGLEKPEIGGQE